MHVRGLPKHRRMPGMLSILGSLAQAVECVARVITAEACYLELLEVILGMLHEACCSHDV